MQNGWLDTVAQGNGTGVDYDYDNAGRVTKILNTQAGGTLLSQFDYTYDDNGNRAQQIETQNGFTADRVVTTDYVYDDLNRLESFTHTTTDNGTVTGVEQHSYTFYPSYNRKTETVVKDGATQAQRTYTYDETYWVETIEEAAPGKVGTITYAYDANGNTQTKTNTTGDSPASSVFTYNNRNQLKTVAAGNAGSEVGQGQYHYNYAGMRIRHLGSSRGNIEYIYDDKSIIDEVVSGTTTPIAHYRYGDRLLSLETSGAEQFYHYASLGTTANLTDASGQNQVAYRVDPYGEITKQEGESVNRQVFTGHEHDTETGLIYMKARFYDPDIGRFLTQDTYLGEHGTPPSLHRYLYAYGNPTVYLDHTGNFPVTEQVSAWFNQRAADNVNALKNVQQEHGSTLGTRSLAAVSGIGNAIFSAAGGIVGLVDMGLDAQASMFQNVPGAENLSIIQAAAEKTAQRKGAIATFATSAKDYVGQDNLGAALKRDGGKGLDATSSYLGDVFIRGNLDATASWSGAMGELASGATLARAAKLSKLDVKPAVTQEKPNINAGDSQNVASNLVADEIAAIRRIGASNRNNSNRAIIGKTKEIEKSSVSARNKNWMSGPANRYIWPDNSKGYDAIPGTIRSHTFNPGDILSRMIRTADLKNYPNGVYDPKYDRGGYTSPAGVPFENRALPGSASDYTEIRLEVLESFDSQRSRAFPWFDKPGRGVQDQLDFKVQDLYDMDAIKVAP